MHCYMMMDLQKKMGQIWMIGPQSELDARRKKKVERKGRRTLTMMTSTRMSCWILVHPVIGWVWDLILEVGYSVLMGTPLHGAV